MSAATNAWIKELEDRVVKLEGRITGLYYILAASILALVLLSYVNYCAISDNMDQAHVHPREN